MPDIKINYQKKLESVLSTLKDTPSLLLHSCCAPCSSYVLEYLSGLFHISILFYNPNIQPEHEYQLRYAEQKRLIREMNLPNTVNFIEIPYNAEEFMRVISGLEKEPEGGKRCTQCFQLRLSTTAKLAKEYNFDYFTTTLSISPHKNAALLNHLGEQYADEFGVSYLYADFKKRGGFKRSIALSQEYSLYRQDYCGCLYSKRKGN